MSGNVSPPALNAGTMSPVTAWNLLTVTFVECSTLKPSTSAERVVNVNFVDDEEVLNVLRQAKRAPEPPIGRAPDRGYGTVRAGDRTGADGECARPSQ